MRLVQFVEKTRAIRPPYHRVSCYIGAFKDATETTLVNLSLLPQIKENGIIDMVTLLCKGPDFLKTIQEAVKTANLPEIQRADVRILPPITSPDKILGIPENFKDHCESKGISYPTIPGLFEKFPCSIIGPEDVLKHPSVTKELGWEIELGVVIGQQVPAGSQLTNEAACAAIAGYMLLQDITATDYQRPDVNKGQWILGKGIDCFCPLGSSMITADEFPSDFAINTPPYKIECFVNGVNKQSSDLANLVFKPAELIVHLAKYFTLLPGDFMCTGSPAGVGVFRKPQEFLHPGDVLSGTIEHMGSIKNTIV